MHRMLRRCSVEDGYGRSRLVPSAGPVWDGSHPVVWPAAIIGWCFHPERAFRTVQGFSTTRSGGEWESMFGDLAAHSRPRRRVRHLLIGLQIALLVFSLAAPAGTIA